MNLLGEQSKPHTIQLYILSMRIYRYMSTKMYVTQAKCHVLHKISHKAWAIFEPGEITFYFADYNC